MVGNDSQKDLLGDTRWTWCHEITWHGGRSLGIVGGLGGKKTDPCMGWNILEGSLSEIQAGRRICWLDGMPPRKMTSDIVLSCLRDLTAAAGCRSRVWRYQC